MTPCADTEHKIVWVDSADVFECRRCLALIRVAPNVCGWPWCGRPVDDHMHNLAETPVCPPPQTK